MKRILLSTVVGLLLVLASRAHAHSGERLFPFFELTDEDLETIDLNDGQIWEWLDIASEPTLTPLDFQNDFDPADFDFRIWIGWHGATNRIYVAMEQADDIYYNDYDRQGRHDGDDLYRSNMATHDSGIQLWIDGDHSGGIAWPGGPCCSGEEDALIYAGQSQRFDAIAETDGDPHVTIERLQNAYWNHGDWYTLPPYADGGGIRFGEDPTISVTEFYVTPFDLMIWDDEQESIISDLHPSKIVGFWIALTDRDSKALHREDFFIINGPHPGNNTSNNLFDALLLGSGSALPEEEDTAVENDSWGRIKASFR